MATKNIVHIDFAELLDNLYWITLFAVIVSMVGTPWLVASFMGVMTGTMGGIFRDVL